MGESGNAHTLPYVRASLRDPVPAVHIAALGAAATFPEIVSDVEPLLNDNDRDDAFRLKAAKLLGPFPQPTFVHTLFQLLSDPSGNVRNQAALTAGQHRRSEAQPALVLLLRDSSQTVRSTAAWALN
jgi:HEAT repeat protein